MRTTTLAILALAFATTSSAAQGTAADQARLLAIADSALAALSRGDMAAFTDFMIDEAVMIPTSVRDSVARYTIRTRASQRGSTSRTVVTERGFHGEARVSGTVGMVWLPYDLYLDGKWSHCGVDLFTFVRAGPTWKIASLAWSVEQPPACAKHPDGPPRH